ncbi:hypothetical protein AB0M34_08875 [Nocardia sp. NPDC050193]
MTATDREPARDLAIRMLGQPGDLGWVVQAHGELYAAEFGWDISFEALVAEIVAGYAGAHDPAREAGWIATLDDEHHHHSFGRDLVGQNWSRQL